MRGSQLAPCNGPSFNGELQRPVVLVEVEDRALTHAAGAQGVLEDPGGRLEPRQLLHLPQTELADGALLGLVREVGLNALRVLQLVVEHLLPRAQLLGLGQLRLGVDGVLPLDVRPVQPPVLGGQAVVGQAVGVPGDVAVELVVEELLHAHRALRLVQRVEVALAVAVEGAEGALEPVLEEAGAVEERQPGSGGAVGVELQSDDLAGALLVQAPAVAVEGEDLHRRAAGAEVDEAVGGDVAVQRVGAALRDHVVGNVLDLDLHVQGLVEGGGHGHVAEDDVAEVARQIEEVLAQAHDGVELVLHARDAQRGDAAGAQVALGHPAQAVEQHRDHIGVQRVGVEVREGLAVVMANGLDLLEFEPVALHGGARRLAQAAGDGAFPRFFVDFGDVLCDFGLAVVPGSVGLLGFVVPGYKIKCPCAAMSMVVEATHMAAWRFRLQRRLGDADGLDADVIIFRCTECKAAAVSKRLKRKAARYD
ncbi:AfsR/SARP family transcriptional regulator [Babesia caballi]|uniref:AfsR/SARP family transcriptional regulator n=1 Tax=Babesia caballi TaxID=5871 RepID=A0AAV4LXZ0_BABCB|nr:AfsR/SARP family transcriptional regulator [Babesia caballi]